MHITFAIIFKIVYSTLHNQFVLHKIVSIDMDSNAAYLLLILIKLTAIWVQFKFIVLQFKMLSSWTFRWVTFIDLQGKSERCAFSVLSILLMQMPISSIDSEGAFNHQRKADKPTCRHTDGKPKRTNRVKWVFLFARSSYLFFSSDLRL